MPLSLELRATGRARALMGTEYRSIDCVARADSAVRLPD